jgi:hypothetical protein
VPTASYVLLTHSLTHSLVSVCLCVCVCVCVSAAYIVQAVRTAGGKRAGRLSGWHPVDMVAPLPHSSTALLTPPLPHSTTALLTTRCSANVTVVGSCSVELARGSRGHGSRACGRCLHGSTSRSIYNIYRIALHRIALHCIT